MPGLVHKIPNFASRGAFRGAAYDRWLSHLKSHVDRPIDELRGGSLSVLQARCRDLWRNSEIAHGAIETIVTNVVGSGVQVSPRMSDAAGNLLWDDNRRLRDLWREHQKHISVAGDNFTEFTTQALRTFKQDGEHYLLKVFNPKTRFGKEYMTIEGSQLTGDGNAYNLKNPHNNPINMGIETDEFGRRVAYHVFVDGKDSLAGSGTGRKYERIPAERIIPLTELQRYGALRGLPMLVAGILLIADCEELRHATLAKAWLHAAITAVVTSKDRLGASADFPGSGVSTEAAGEFVATGSEVTKSESLGFEQMMIDAGMLLMGDKEMKVDLLDSKTPPAQFSQFDAAMLRGVSAATGLSPIAILRETTGISYSTFRGWLNSDLMLYKQIGEQFDPRVIEPIYQDFVRAVYLEKFILPMPSGVVDLFASKVQHPIPRGIDPLKDQRAFTEAMANGTMSPETVCAAQGRDIFEEIASRKQVLEACKRAGVDSRAFFGQTPSVISDEDIEREEREAGKEDEDAA